MSRRRRIWLLIALFAAVELPMCLGIWIPGADILIYLLIGWIRFLIRVVPAVHVRWDMAASAVVYALLLVAGSHLFLRWLYRETGAAAGDSGRRWRWRWTLSGFAIVLLMFSAGMAAIGVVHQSAWLATSPKPFYVRNVRSARLYCDSNLLQIGRVIELYAITHGGAYPDDFSTLLLTEDLPPSVFICPGSTDTEATGSTPAQIAQNLKAPGHCSYFYLGKGLSGQIDPRRVVVVELPQNHDDQGINALHADGTVEWIDGEAAGRLLESVGLEKEYPIR